MTRNLRTSAFLSMAGIVGLWAVPNAFGKVLAQEDYGSYAPGVAIDTLSGGGTGFAGDWKATTSNSYWGDPIVADGPLSFDGKILATGNQFLGGRGRLQRMLTTPVTTGVVWVSYVFNPKDLTNIGENQFWIASGESKARAATYNNDNTTTYGAEDAASEAFIRSYNVVAGLRVLGTELMYYDTSLPLTVGASEGDDPLTTDVQEDSNPLTVGGAGEVYHKFTLVDGTTPVTVTTSLLMVAKIDVVNNLVSYYVFTPGADTSDVANATYKKEGLAVSADRQAASKSSVAGIAMFTVQNTRSALGNIRIAQNYKEATPTHNAWAYAAMSRSPIAVDNTSWWTNAQPMPVTKLWADGGKNVAATNAADFSANSFISWDATNLYVAVAVKDQEVIKTGSPETIELYLDGNLSRGADLSPWPTNYDQVDDFQLIFKLSDTAAEGATIEGAWSDNPTGNPLGYKGAKGSLFPATTGTAQNFDGITYKATTTADGYILTAVINLATVLHITEPYFGQYIGYDVAVIDFDQPAVPTDPVTYEKSQYFASDTANANWNGTQNFGTLALLPAVDPIASDDFAGYTTDDVLDGNGAAGNGWADGWYKVWQPSWTGAAKATTVAAGPLTFEGDMLVSGNHAGGGGSFGRVARELATPLAASGSYWVGFVMSKGGHLQVRLDSKGTAEVDTANGTTNLDPSSVAGFTMAGGEIQALDSSKSPTYSDASGPHPEVYTSMAGWPYPEGNAFYVINVDYDMAKVNYYVFFSGDDLSDPMNATLQQSFDLNTERAQTFDCFTMFTVFSDVTVGNLVIGDDYNQLVKPAAIDPVKTAVAHMTATPPTLDGTMDEIWAASPEYPITLIHGGKDISNADLDGTFRVLWDANNVYLFFSVTDDDLIQVGSTVHPEKDVAVTPVTYQVDEFEVFIDGGYERSLNPVAGGWPPYTDKNDVQLVFAPGATFTSKIAPSQFGNSVNPNKGAALVAGLGSNATVAGVATAGGYSAEVKIPLTSLGTNQAVAIGSMIGLEIQLNDRDLPQGTLPAAGGSYPYASDGKKGWADGANKAWQQTATHGTLYFAPAAVDAYTLTVDAATPPPISRDGGTANVNVGARFQYSNWTAVAQADQSAWNTVSDDSKAGTGDGVFEVVLDSTDSPYTRTANITVGINSIAIAQQGLLSVSAEAKFPGLTPVVDSPGVFKHPWLGNLTISSWPWIGTVNHGWLWFGSTSAKNTDTASWLWDIKNGWLFSGNGIAPFFFSATTGKWMWYGGNGIDGEVEFRWFYVFESDGSGAWTMIDKSL